MGGQRDGLGGRVQVGWHRGVRGGFGRLGRGGGWGRDLVAELEASGYAGDS